MFHLKRDETIKRLRCKYRRTGLVVGAGQIRRLVYRANAARIDGRAECKGARRLSGAWPFQVRAGARRSRKRFLDHLHRRMRRPVLDLDLAWRAAGPIVAVPAF